MITDPGPTFLQDAFTAERVANHAIKFTVALNRLWTGGQNVNWEAEVRREILYIRRNIADLERAQFARCPWTEPK